MSARPFVNARESIRVTGGKYRLDNVPMSQANHVVENFKGRPRMPSKCCTLVSFVKEINELL